MIPLKTIMIPHKTIMIPHKTIMILFSILFLVPCVCLAKNKNQEEIEVIYVEDIKNGPSVTLPIPLSESAKLVDPGNASLGLILDCNIQSQISDPSALNEGYSFLRCKQLLTEIKTLAPQDDAADIIIPILPGEGGDTNKDDPKFGASKSKSPSSDCRDLIFNKLDIDAIRYQIQERGIKAVIVNFGDPDSNRTSHLVWTANYGAEYLLEQSFWYRLFSVVPMAFSISEFSLFSNATGELGDLDQETLDRCADYIFVPEINSEDRLGYLMQRESSLVYDLQQTIGADLPFQVLHRSAVCARVTNNTEEDDDYSNVTVGEGQFQSSACHLDYICCPQNDPANCHQVHAMPCLLYFYKVLLYVFWWLIAVPVLLVLPFHAAFERCDANGNHDRKHGDYYKINSTSSMLFTLICRSIATKFVVYILLILLVFYQIWAEFGRYDNWLDIPWWVYLFLLAIPLLVALFKIFWELWGKDIDAELHRPTRFADRIVRDTFWGAVELPEKCQFRESIIPIRSGIRLHIIYRLRLLLQDSYWVFCARDLPRSCCKNKICGIILAPITIILGILNALPAIYLLSCLINAAKNRKRIQYMKKRWLGFLIFLIILFPVCLLASYTVLMILYHSTSIIILDLNTLPVLVLYIFLLDYVWQNLRRISLFYTEIIAFLIEEHQRVVECMHKGYLAVTQHSDVYDTYDKPLPGGGVKRRAKINSVYNRSFRDTLRRESNMAALRAELPSRKTDDQKATKPKKRKIYTLDFEDRATPTNPASKSSTKAPLIPAGNRSSFYVPAPNTMHLLLHYHGHVLYINAEFHKALLETLLPPSVCAFKLVANMLLLGFGYAILDEFFRCYAPFVPCCLYILFFMVLGLSRVLLAIQQNSYCCPQDLRLQVRALVENYYAHLYVDPDETGKLDLMLSSNVDSTEITDIESVTTADDVPLWPGRISFREDPGYDADHNGSMHSRGRGNRPSRPQPKPQPKRQPIPEALYAVPAPKQQSQPKPKTPEEAPKRAPVVQSPPKKAPVAASEPTSPRRPPQTSQAPQQPPPRPVSAEPKPKPVPKRILVATPDPDEEPEERRPPRQPVRTQTLPKTISVPLRTQPPPKQPQQPLQSQTLPTPRKTPTSTTTTSPTKRMTIQYVPLIDRPSDPKKPTQQQPQRPWSMLEPQTTSPQDFPDGGKSPPEQQQPPRRPAFQYVPYTVPTRPKHPAGKPAPWSPHQGAESDPEQPTQDIPPGTKRTTTTTIYVRVPNRPHPKPAQRLASDPYRDVQSEPDIPYCDEETSDDDLTYDWKNPVPSPTSQPVEHSNTYSILPALEEEPVNSTRTATLKRHLGDRYSQPEPIQILLPDGGYHTLQHQPPQGQRQSAGPAYYRHTPPNSQPFTRSSENL